ncbi:MAG: hypothetical protein AB7G11_14415 [Phycisphaerales bacterium]
MYTGRSGWRGGFRNLYASIRALILLLMPVISAHAQSYSTIAPYQVGSFGTSGFGISGVAGISDLDGDGFGDVVVGAPIEDAGTPLIGDAGRCYVFSGHTGERLQIIIAPILHGFGEFGFAVTSLGDIDSDGAGDFAVSEPLGSAGYVHLISGSERTVIRTLTYPPGGGGAFGLVLAPLEDPMLGPVERLLIGAPYADGTTGLGYIYSVQTGEVLTTVHSPTPRSGGYFAYLGCVVPDLDGDGERDFAFRANERNSEGNNTIPLHVFSGATGLHLYTIYPSADALYGGFAQYITGVGDLDGDGSGDLVVTAYYQDTPGLPTSAGAAYVYSGATGQLLYSLFSPRPTQSGTFGRGVLGLPDITGDGFGDILVSAPQETPPGYPPHAGVSYIFSGHTGQLYRTIVSPRPRPLAIGDFGYTPTLLPDTSGDGRPDLLIFSQDGCDASCNQPARGYILHSCAADYNYDGVLNSQDFYDFIVAFFGGPISYSPDFNHDGAVNTQDFFDYFTAFLSGCP